MKVVFTACDRCGAPNQSPFGRCPDCESREVAARVAAKRRVRERHPRGVKRAA